jgi:hypothetical protein
VRLGLPIAALISILLIANPYGPLADYWGIAFGCVVLGGLALARAHLASSHNIRSVRLGVKGFAWLGLCLSFFAAAVTKEFLTNGFLWSDGVIAFAAFGVLPFLLFRTSAGLRKRQWMLLQAANIIEPGVDDFMLYLRPFNVDDELEHRSVRHYLRMWLNNSEALLPAVTREEALVQRLQRHMAVVAIGDPREELPKLGAQRVYVDDAEWQSHVEHLMHLSAGVIVRIGDTSGLLWELRAVVRLLEPSAVILWNDAQGGRWWRRRAKAARRLQELASGILPQPIPDGVARQEFVWFGDDWTPYGSDDITAMPLPMSRNWVRKSSGAGRPQRSDLSGF